MQEGLGKYCQALCHNSKQDRDTQNVDLEPLPKLEVVQGRNLSEVRRGEAQIVCHRKSPPPPPFIPQILRRPRRLT
jgi:hypothetical protein